MKINLYGYGFVGKAHYEVFKEHHDVNIIDPLYPDLEQKDFDADAAIVCVATPQADTGECDMTNVYDVFSKIPKSVPVLIKSTISLEGWKSLKEQFPDHSINFSPEFLRQDTFLEDFFNMEKMFLTGEQLALWGKLFNPHWQGLKFVVGEPEELILIKYFRNSFLATKVAFFNQVYDLCEVVGVNFDEVRAGITQDSRIGSSHSFVSEERGYSGHCLPKDITAILKTAETNSANLTLIKEADRYNSEIRNEDTANRS